MSEPTLVFISHSGSIGLTGEVITTLQAAFPDVEFWSDEKLTLGKWNPRVREKLRQSNALVVIGTHSILQSVYVGYEIGYVDDRLGSDAVVIARCGLDNRDLQNRPPLGDFQSYNCEKPDDLQKMIQSISTLIGKSTSNAPIWEDLAHNISIEVAKNIDKPETGTDRPRYVSKLREWQVKILPESATSLIAVKADLANIERMLKKAQRNLERDYHVSFSFYNSAQAAAEKRSRAGVPEGEMKSKMDRIFEELHEVQQALLAKV